MLILISCTRARNTNVEIPQDKHMDGLEIMTFMWWLFFTLIYSYYCGVLTMFFATPISIPFDTLESVIQAYPNWRLMIQDGTEGWFNDMAKAGDPDYMTIWQRYLGNPTETAFHSIEHGIELIEKGQNVIFIDKTALILHKRSNPFMQKIHTITTPSNIYSNNLGYLLLHKNSPLHPIFMQGTSHFRESGLESQLIYHSLGGSEQSATSPSEGHILAIGETVTVFLMMLTVCIVALIVLCGEVTYKRFLKKDTMCGKAQHQK